MNNKNSSRVLAIEMVGFDKRVLEIGTKYGHVTKELKERNNVIIGIELDPDAGLISQQYCEQLVIGDVESLPLDELLQKASFDVILLNNVLDNFKNPFDLLKNLKKFLKSEGFIVISLPNIGHGDVIINIMNGDFHYTAAGLLDRSHIRFFGIKNAIIFFSECGFQISDMRTINIDIGKTEQKIDDNNYSDILLEFVKYLPYSSVYEFVFKITPSEYITKPKFIEFDLSEKFSQYIDNYAKKIVSEKLTEKNSQILNLEREIIRLKSSMLYQLTIKFDKIILDRLFPSASRRRLMYFHLLDAGRILINDGFGPFWMITKRKFFKKKRKSTRNLLKRDGDSIALINKTITIDPSQYTPPENLNIAVHAHVYYIDLFEEICQYLENIQFKYSLYISVKCSDDKTFVTERVKKLSHIDNFDIQIVENRGRDVAPFLVYFGPSLKNHDLICHIHTKKSLFSGEEKVEWRKYLLDRILGSKDSVNAILQAFKEDSSIGIIYPEIYPFLPHWTCTWLSNKHTASAFLERLNIRFDPDEYFDYPVGSMFWIRKDALKPLLNLKLKLDDFPQELGQNDGALQHTIERCYVKIAQESGFKYLVVQDPNRHVFSYQSSRNFYKYLETPFEEKILVKYPTIKILSLDIFDTLLIRPFATPSMVFSYLEEKISKKYQVPNFKRDRILAESIARKRKNYQGDVKISEIYPIFSELTHIDSTIADKLLQLEVETERLLLTPRYSILESAKKAKELDKRVILVSDTYLERDHIEKILSSNGFDFISEMYLSCEIGKRKDRGDLWDYIFKKENFSRNNFVHIGDNEQSDLQVVGDRGYAGNLIHVMRPTALFRQSKIGTLLWDVMRPFDGWRENLLYGTLANCFCSDPDGNNLFKTAENIEDPRIFGYAVIGPIIFTFINWLIKTSIKDECNQLWFVAREGYLLKAAYQKYQEHPAFTHMKDKFPAGKYILSSRRSAIFASIKTEDDIPKLLEGKFRGSLRSFFVGRLHIKDIQSIENQIGSPSLERYVTLPKDRESICACVKTVFDILLKEAVVEREALLKYYDQSGFENTEKIALVDLGYSGTIQSAIGKTLNHPIHGYYFVTTPKASKLSLSGLLCKACFKENADRYSDPPPIFRYSLLLEAVLTAPTGQFIRFEENNGKEIQPVFKEPGIPQKEFSKISQIHEGILEYITDMIDKFGLSALEIEYPNDLVQFCYEQVIKGNIQIGDIKSLLVVEDEYSGNDEIVVLDLYTELEKIYNN